MKFRSLILAFMIALVSAGQLLAEQRQVGWDDLIPSAPAPAIENPFDAMQPEQIDILRKILRLELGLEPGDTDAVVEAAELRAKLEAEGLDVDDLFAKREEIMEQRRRVAESVNEDLVEKDVRLPGYLLPLEMRDRKAVEFLLVPTVGACIHTPPPPANQVVHVRYPEGFAVDGLYTPVWINGRLKAESSTQRVGYSDGQARVTVSYAMQPDVVEPYN
jgi:uncharacterized protein